ncbi:hypothetical protein BV898_13201 [Hypsibius exemplaris]|uniref:Glycoamylase-like domain-containing protein n=1 Tax=Hypsibius exemplaris TaxID=2072580 RepID=A0A1W0WBL2_HYPEX|nr:hypothetical protein BV898_13201 [Hypsibius exemplaris]
MGFPKFCVISLILLSVVILQTAGATLTTTDHEFLEDLEKRAFQFFWEHSNNGTGLTLDRTRTTGEAAAPGTHNHNIASIAASGFALVSYCIASNRNWAQKNELLTRTRNTLDFFAHRAPHKEGWFYHWMDAETGVRRWSSEISSIDTALLLGGVLTVKQCFKENEEIVRMATAIYERVDFRWMLNGDANYLSHGWTDENNFLASRWTDYSEQTMLNLLAIASPTFNISWTTWYALKRDYRTYKNHRYISAVPPLFIHQYSHAFFDYRGKRETFSNFSVDYFENSVVATRVQQEFFAEELSGKWPHYSANLWGLTASDSADGYKAWGAPPEDPTTDGTVVPCAAGGSLMFAPEITLPTLRSMKEKYPHTYGRYGFADAFNPATNWTNSDVLGIDVGITLLSAENLRTGKVWAWFMANPEAQEALRRVHLLDVATSTSSIMASTNMPSTVPPNLDTTVTQTSSSVLTKSSVLLWLFILSAIHRTM